MQAKQRRCGTAGHSSAVAVEGREQSGSRNADGGRGGEPPFFRPPGRGRPEWLPAYRPDAGPPRPVARGPSSVSAPAHGQAIGPRGHCLGIGASLQLAFDGADRHVPVS